MSLAHIQDTFSSSTIQRGERTRGVCVCGGGYERVSTSRSSLRIFAKWALYSLLWLGIFSDTKPFPYKCGWFGHTSRGGKRSAMNPPSPTCLHQPHKNDVHACREWMLTCARLKWSNLIHHISRLFERQISWQSSPTTYNHHLWSSRNRNKAAVFTCSSSMTRMWHRLRSTSNTFRFCADNSREPMIAP